MPEHLEEVRSTLLCMNDIVVYSSQKDEGVLEHLEDVRSTLLDEEVGLGFRLDFHFAADNGYMTNRVLSKTFYMRDLEHQVCYPPSGPSSPPSGPSFHPSSPSSPLPLPPFPLSPFRPDSSAPPISLLSPLVCVASCCVVQTCTGALTCTP